MKMIAQTLGVSRSNLSQRMKESPKTRSHYQKTTDAEVLPQIRTLVDWSCPYKTGQSVIGNKT